MDGDKNTFMVHYIVSIFLSLSSCGLCCSNFTFGVFRASFLEYWEERCGGWMNPAEGIIGCNLVIGDICIFSVGHSTSFLCVWRDIILATHLLGLDDL